MFKKCFLVFAAILLTLRAFGISEDSVEAGFFDRFNDENLSRYILEACTNNHSLKQAASKVEQYRWQVKYSLGGELPSLSVGANYMGMSTPEISNFHLSDNAFALPFTVSYEADFLLKNRDKTKAFKKAFEAEQLNEKTVYIALLSDVATVYSNILQYDKLVENQTKIAEISNGILALDEHKFSRGLIDAATLNNSKKRANDARNKLENYIKERDVFLLQLAVLTANEPSSPILRGKIENFEYGGKIPSEISSDVIFARPDVQAAEKQLEKAKIDVRVARKEFLPSFNITGVWAFSTLAPGSFFSWDSSLAMLIAGATQDIFSGGKKAANLKIQKAKYEEIFENYRQVDLEAAKEVNSALLVVKHSSAVDKNTGKKLEFEEENFNSFEKKFNQGIISKPELLEAELKLLEQENEAANAKAARLVSYFTLYKSTGGQL